MSRVTTGVVGVGPEMVRADMAYDADGLRAGGAQAGQAAGTAGGVAGGLAPVSCEMAMFGMVAGAAGLAAAVLRSRDAHQQLAEQAATVHADASSRVEADRKSGGNRVAFCSTPYTAAPSLVNDVPTVAAARSPCVRVAAKP